MRLNVNGEERTFRGAADTPLLWVLRDTLGLKGTKYGCGVGVCGSCIVLIDGEPRHACTSRVDEVSGKSVVTIEGFARKPEHPVIQAWIAEQVPQCGYCHPAQVLTAAWLLGRHPHPSDAEIDNALSPVLCRCGSYPRIRRAVRRAAEMLAGKARHSPCSTAALCALPAAGPGDAEGYVFNPWVRIARDGTITVVIDRSEMGQGAITGLAARDEGDVARALKQASHVVEALYETPYLAHATMEPMNCIAEVRDDGCDIWAGTQAQEGAQRRTMDLTGLPRERVRVHTTYLGGGFGRRLESDFVAEAVQVAEVSVAEKGALRVERVVCAADCGTLINPDAAAAQMEGGIIFGLSAALHGRITLHHGAVMQSSFEDYPLVTMRDAPEIEVHFVNSRHAPGGVGEPGVPPIAPAVANAVFAATGRRIRRLPLFAPAES